MALSSEVPAVAGADARAIPADLFFQTKIFWPLALLLIVVTRGRLGYRRVEAEGARAVQ